MEAINKTKVFQKNNKTKLANQTFEKTLQGTLYDNIVQKTYFENGKTSKAYTRKTKFNNDYTSGAVDFG